MFSSLEREGFEIIADIVPQREIDFLTRELVAPVLNKSPQPKRNKGGVRNLLNYPVIAELASSEKLTRLVEHAGNFFPVRAIFFDKTPEANWLVPWHQDLSIAVAERIECVGFGPWTIKARINHVQPPVDILEKMVSIRVHLDDCDQANGALKVLPGSHQCGKLDSKEIENWKKKALPVVCDIQRGGVLLMKPLLLHSSSASLNPNHRRVIHIEYALESLPGGLRWFEKIS